MIPLFKSLKFTSYKLQLTLVIAKSYILVHQEKFEPYYGYKIVLATHFIFISQFFVGDKI